LIQNSNFSKEIIGTKALFIFHRKYLSVQPNSTLQWNRDQISESEKFTISELSPGKFNLKGFNGKYLCAEDRGRVICDRNKPAQWETFTIEKHRDEFSV
jgi:hypothetical protein